MKNQHVKALSLIKGFRFLLLFSLFLIFNSAYARLDLSELPDGVYTLDKSHASILWKISHLGLSPYVARFTDFDMDLSLDTNDMSNSSVTAVVNAASIDTENEKFNQELIGKKWFKTEKFPTITFISSSYQPNSVDKGKLIGTLDMLGVKKTVEFDVKIGGTVDDHPFISNSAGIGFTASTVIKRSDWGFGKLVSFGIGNEVSIEIHAEFFKEKQY